MPCAGSSEDVRIALYNFPGTLIFCATGLFGASQRTKYNIFRLNNSSLIVNACFFFITGRECFVMPPAIPQFLR